MEVNGTTLRKLNHVETVIVVERLFRTHGSDIGHPRLSELMRAEGLQPCGVSTHYRIKNLYDAQPPIPSLDPDAVVPGYAEEGITAEGMGTLQDFIRFAAVVEAVGGFRKARHYLSHLERMLAGR